MTKDVVLISKTSEDSFARDVHKAITELESYGYECDVKFSTTEGRLNDTVYSALIIAK